jgi:glycerophosphoryl diester phosphodiesterase
MSIKRLFRWLLLVVLLLALAAGAYAFVYDPEYDGAAIPVSKPLVFSHRGFGDHGPDNSMAAALAGLDAGADGVDVDAQLTKDGKIVVFHDLRLDRLTSSSGKVGDYTLAELEKLDLAPKFPGRKADGTRYERAYVASFEEFVKRVSPEGILMVELKVTRPGDTGIEREAVRILRKHDAFDRVYLSSFNPIVIKRLESTEPRVVTVWAFMDTNWNAELLAEMRPEDVVDLPWFLRKEWTRRGLRKLLRPDMLSVNVEVAEQTRTHLIEQGWPVLLWAPNTKREIADALAQRPYGIISDEPTEVLRQLR